MNALTVAPKALRLTDYTSSQLALIKRTVAKDTNSDEFDLFMAVASQKGLDPFSKQIAALVFSKDDPAKRNMAIITQIDGMRSIAARSGRYRPDEDEPEYEYDESEKGPANPKGIIKAKVKIFIADSQVAGGWKRATGVAYWEEFAPLKDEVEGGFDWVDTGEVWADTGKPKKRKVPRQEGAQVIRQLDTSGNWGKMPRIMLAKCAEAQVLRKAFPEDLSGIYERAEFDRAQLVEITASEAVEEHHEQARLVRIGASNSIMFQLQPTEAIGPIPLGKIFDRVIEGSREWDFNKFRWFMSVNKQPLQEYWARAKVDALALKAELEKIGGRLQKEAEEAAAAEQAEAEGVEP